MVCWTVGSLMNSHYTLGSVRWLVSSESERLLWSVWFETLPQWLLGGTEENRTKLRIVGAPADMEPTTSPMCLNELPRCMSGWGHTEQTRQGGSDWQYGTVVSISCNDLSTWTSVRLHQFQHSCDGTKKDINACRFVQLITSTNVISLIKSGEEWKSRSACYAFSLPFCHFLLIQNNFRSGDNFNKKE